MTQSTYPLNGDPQFANQIDQLFAKIFERIEEARKGLRQRPALLRVGKENIGTTKAPPSIVVVPIGCRYEPARKWADSLEPKPLWSQWLICDCECWGDDDPSGLVTQYAFSSALELVRELLVAMSEENYGPASIRPTIGEFEQELNVNRLGRKYTFRVELETFVTKVPPIQVQASIEASVSIQGDPTEAIVFAIPGGGTDPNEPQ
jgi:hypothetical protein